MTFPLTCCVCNKIILPTESCTSINNDHYHGQCFDRQLAKREKPNRGRAVDHKLRAEARMTEPLHEGEVVGRFRADLLVDTGTVLAVIPAPGGAQAYGIHWESRIEPRAGDAIRRILR
jgi:hypothetical protein